MRYRITRRAREALLRRLDLTAEFVDPLTSLPIMPRDSQDVQILGAAIAADVDFQVTGDSDLLVLGGDTRLGRLQIVPVRQFLTILGEIPPSGEKSAESPRD